MADCLAEKISAFKAQLLAQLNQQSTGRRLLAPVATWPPITEDDIVVSSVGVNNAAESTFGFHLGQSSLLASFDKFPCSQLIFFGEPAA